MSFFEFLEKIRNKPRRTRTQIMWVCVFFSMLIVVFLWGVSFKKTINQPIAEKETEKEMVETLGQLKEKAPSLFSSIKESFNSFFDDWQASRESEKDQLDQEWEKLKNEPIPDSNQETENNYQPNRLPSRP